MFMVKHNSSIKFCGLFLPSGNVPCSLVAFLPPTPLLLTPYALSFALPLLTGRLQFMGEVEYSLSQRSFHVTLLRGVSAAQLEEVCQCLHRTLSRAEASEAEKVHTRTERASTA